MINDVLQIKSIEFPYDANEKIFECRDENGDICGDPYSYNDWIKQIENISGVNEELLGK